MPRRLQRRRIKGYRLPPGTVCVTRGTRWGNPYKIEDYGLVEALRLFEEDMKDPDRRDAARRELRGRDLACYCPLDQPCHADILLRIANE